MSDSLVSIDADARGRFLRKVVAVKVGSDDPRYYDKMHRAEHRRAERALWRSQENARPAGSTRLAVGGKNRDGVAWLEGDPLLMVEAWPEGTRIHV